MKIQDIDLSDYIETFSLFKNKIIMKKKMVSRISAERRTMVSITCKHICRLKKSGNN